VKVVSLSFEDERKNQRIIVFVQLPMIEGCCMVRTTVTTTTQGRMISDARGGGTSSSSTDGASAVPKQDIETASMAFGDRGDDHADIGMDLSSADEEEEDSSSMSKDQFSSIPPPYTNNPTHSSNEQPNHPHQQQHVTDDSEASSAPDYTKKRRRRPSESTSTTPSPSHWSSSPHASQSQHDNTQHTNCTDCDPVAVSGGSPDEEITSVSLPRLQPPTAPQVEVATESEGSQQHHQLQQQQQASDASTSAAPRETLPQHQQFEEVAPLDISYRYTPASIKLKDTLVSRLSMAFPTGMLQVVS
jgi:hypothetical protein